MSSIWGERVKISIFGESHGEAIGVVLDGLPAGIELGDVTRDMERRTAAKRPGATARVEKDVPRIISGVYNGKTTGTPLAAIIENKDVDSEDYDMVCSKPRPGHADYTAAMKYKGMMDMRGGGHFSGRLTASLVFAGAVARSYLATRGVTVGSHIAMIGGIEDEAFDPLTIDKEQLLALYDMEFPVRNSEVSRRMVVRMENAEDNMDSVGGIVECAVLGMPVGIGGMMFGGLESRISSMLFGIPAVKGVEFGRGFEFGRLTGKASNDQMQMSWNHTEFLSNNCGGILGGISNGSPIIVRAAFKPTPSIESSQRTVDLKSLLDVQISVKGRHDICVVPRALPAVEAGIMIAIMDAMVTEDVCENSTISDWK